MLTILIHSTDETISQKQFHISVIVIETCIGDVFRESQILLVILERISSTKLDTFVVTRLGASWREVTQALRQMEINLKGKAEAAFTHSNFYKPVYA